MFDGHGGKEVAHYSKNHFETCLKQQTEFANGDYKEGGATLRAKIDLKSSNMLMRDPVLYRIKKHTH